ncbi:odorant receptor 13a-like [Polyergus mexicanus]|uniref:odorant receptor 13a-like n=1 Tax=Polyergus mexicanus TaxID=615972 RepID=UPI0038B65C7B
MSIKADSEYAYGWNRYTMTFMGIWPENFGQISSYKAIVPVLTMFCFVCAPQSANLLFIWGDFDSVVENLSMANVTITISLLKTIIFWLNGGSMRILMSYMKRDWSATVDKRDRKMMLDIAKLTRNLSISSTIMVQIVAIAYVTFRFIVIRHTGRQLFFRAYFPYNVSSSPCYELTFLGQLIANMFAATTYAAVDTFIATLVLHTCGQLANLRRELTNLRACTRAEFQAKMRKIVRKHEYLNRFAETIEDCFNRMLLIQMLGCSMQLCFQCLQAFMSMFGEMNQLFLFQIIFLVIYVVYILLQLYLYCYIGERLFIESTKIADAAYDCSWYNLSACEAKLLIIIMCRARLPLHITAGRFCCFNRELFSEILKRSVAYMSCLCTMNSLG